MKNEPVLTTASITAGVTALLALLVAFGIPVTEEQQIAILGVVAVAAPFAVALVARNLVTPNGSVLEYNNGDGIVRAGAASEVLATGEPVRASGDYAPIPVEEVPEGDEELIQDELDLGEADEPDELTDEEIEALPKSDSAV